MSKATKGKRIMRELKLHEISSVTVPAQQGALAAIMKSAEPKDDTAARLLKAWVDPADGAKPFSEVLRITLEDQQYREVMDEVYPLVCALETSIRSIVADADIDISAKQTMLRSSVEEFLTTVSTKWPEVEEVLEKIFKDLGIGNEEDVMTKEELAALQKQVADLATKVTDQEAAAKAAAEKHAAELKAAQDALAKAEADAKLATAKASLTKDEREFFDAIKDEAASKAFLEMTAEKRAEAIALAKAGVETITVYGQTVSKAAVGAEMFTVLKAQADENAKLAKALAEETEARKTAEYKKRAADELGSLPGTEAEKVELLKSLDSMGGNARKTLDTMLKAGAANTEGAFKSLGHKGGPSVDNGSSDVSKAVGDFNKAVATIKNRDKCSNMEAHSRARVEHPDLYEAYQTAN